MKTDLFIDPVGHKTWLSLQVLNWQQRSVQESRQCVHLSYEFQSEELAQVQENEEGAANEREICFACMFKTSYSVAEFSDIYSQYKSKSNSLPTRFGKGALALPTSFGKGALALPISHTSSNSCGGSETTCPMGLHKYKRVSKGPLSPFDYVYSKIGGKRIVSFWHKYTVSQQNKKVKTIKIIDEFVLLLSSIKKYLFRSGAPIPAMTILLLLDTDRDWEVIHLVKRVFENSKILSRIGFLRDDSLDDDSDPSNSSSDSDDLVLARRSLQDYEKLGYLNVYFTDVLEHWSLLEGQSATESVRSKIFQLEKLKLVMDILCYVCDIFFPTFRFACWAPIYSEGNDYDCILQLHLHCDSCTDCLGTESDTSQFDKYVFLDKLFNLRDSKKLAPIFQQVKASQTYDQIMKIELTNLYKCNYELFDEEFVYRLYESGNDVEIDYYKICDRYIADRIKLLNSVIVNDLINLIKSMKQSNFATLD